MRGRFKNNGKFMNKLCKLPTFCNNFAKDSNFVPRSCISKSKLKHWHGKIGFQFSAANDYILS